MDCRRSLRVVVLVVICGHCGGLALGAAPEEIAPFTEEALARGLDCPMAAYPQPQGFDGQGAGFTDLDGDGDQDVLVIGAPNRRLGVFENLGSGVFADRSSANGIVTMTEMEGFAAADYDGDGRVDIYLTRDRQPNVLLKNLGGFQFLDVAAVAGTQDMGPSTGASWADYDGDGWLDLYVCNYSGFAPGDPPNVLYRNNGDGTFDEVGSELGVDSTALSFQSVWTDYDRDGDPDLYVSNDRGPVGWPSNQLWRNDGGVFVDVSAESGADATLFSMGLATGDFDGNLYPDFYTTDLAGDCPTGYASCPMASGYTGWNPLLLNQGDGSFVESAAEAGVATHETGWGAIFFDFDNNGFKDLYVNNMWVPNSLFANEGQFPCVEIAATVGVQASYDPNFDLEADPPATIASYSSAVADVNGDGAVDLLVNNVGHRAELFINNEGSKRNFVRYNVIGEYPNLFAVGASIETSAAGRTWFDESYAGGNGYLGQNEIVIHVGLGDTEVVDEVMIRWPSNGPVRTLTGLPANHTWSIYPPGRLCDFDGAGIDHDDFLVFTDCHDAGFEEGCEMMDFDGDSLVAADDLLDCFSGVAGDCNGNGTNDYLEILFQESIDGDQNGEIDCCTGGSTAYPNPVGASLRVARGPADEVELLWEAPASDAAHDPATSYDVWRSDTASGGGFQWVAGVSVTGYQDVDATDPLLLYRIVARNACGTSGEEPL